MRLVIQGCSDAQVVGETPSKHLPRRPRIKKPERRKTLDSYIQRLSSPAGYSRFTYFTVYIINNKTNDDIIVTLFAREDQ